MIHPPPERIAQSLYCTTCLPYILRYIVSAVDRLEYVKMTMRTKDAPAAHLRVFVSPWTESPRYHGTRATKRQPRRACNLKIPTPIPFSLPLLRKVILLTGPRDGIPVCAALAVITMQPSSFKSICSPPDSLRPAITRHAKVA